MTCTRGTAGLASAFLLTLLVSSSFSHIVPEGGHSEDVVSKYTTLPPTVPTPRPLDVYQQIANNIAERITQPIYRWLGYTDSSPRAPKKQRLELAEDLTSSEDAEDNTVEGAAAAGGRDVEPLSNDAQRRLDKAGDNKPEKVTLYSSYLPAAISSNKSVTNVTSTITNNTRNIVNTNNISNNSLAADDEFDFDDFAEPEPTDKQTFSGGWVYVLEAVGSFFTLLFGAIAAYFRPGT